MQKTAELLNRALSQEAMPYWTKKLGLARQTLHTSKVRGHLSPAVAGALAEELGEDAQKWMVIANAQPAYTGGFFLSMNTAFKQCSEAHDSHHHCHTC